MLMSTDVASIMLPVSRGILDRERDVEAAAGPHASAAGGPAAVRGMKRGDPEPDAQTAAALADLPGAECKRARIDGTGAVGDVGQVWRCLCVSAVGNKNSPSFFSFFSSELLFLQQGVNVLTGLLSLITNSNHASLQQLSEPESSNQGPNVRFEVLPEPGEAGGSCGGERDQTRQR